MTSHNIRLFLFAALTFVGFLLFNDWQKEQVEKVSTLEKTRAVERQIPEDKDIPSITHKTEGVPLKTETAEAVKSGKTTAQTATQTISVSTDVLNLKIDLEGGDIVELDLPAYADDKEPPRLDYTLFDQTTKRYYIAQSGLTGEMGPDLRGVGRAKYTSTQNEYRLVEGQDRLEVELATKTKEGISVTKRFVFLRGDYLISIEYLINNASNREYKGSFYAGLKRKPEPGSGSSFMGIQTFTGAAVNTPETPYKKFTFKDMAEKPFSMEVESGWAAMVEHYFVGAWVPAPGIVYTYQTQSLEDGTYVVRLIAPPVTVAPQAQESITAKLYAGPQVTENLAKIAPGLELTVDYGILWPICKPIFWVLKEINSLVHNWGWSIVIITLLIKILFYKLSATSYRSMGNMRKLQPKIEALKQRHGEDKSKFSQAVMELYRKEKINPLGGCLPIIIQIPVFIALYYVLLGSVELRQAPFIFWITDLSAKDPYYVLPILMGITMFVQQKLNPAPPDPVQAKVMMLMPIIFTVLFLNFPAGLVLYWLVNNLLSIIQQWFITRKIEVIPAHGGVK